VDGPVTVYVSLPLSGPRAAEGRSAADGARLALEQAGGRAGDLEVRAEFLDDAAAPGEPGRERSTAWDPAATAANARAAAQDSTSVAYIGELDSQPTRTSLPITNDAGLAQISPTAGAVDLARPAAGYPDSPNRYRPSGEVTFARLVAGDDEVAAAAARLALDGGYRSVRVPVGDDPYEKLVAQAFTTSAAEVGLETTSSGPAEGTMRARPDGAVVVEPEPRAAAARLVVEATLRPVEATEPSAGSAPAVFLDDVPGYYGAYGYEAMELALQAIGEAAGGERELRQEVVEAVLGAERPDSLLGSYVLNDGGEPDLCVRPCPQD
jgi:ABC-type branched-subunit amino acid transport system substrate-binding protein